MLVLDDSDRAIPLWAYGWLILSDDQRETTIAVLRVAAMLARDPLPLLYAADALRGLDAEFRRKGQEHEA